MELDSNTNGVSVTLRDGVTVVQMDREENRFHPDLLTALEAVLDHLDARDEPAALVLTGSGKFFSNGLDLEYLGGHPEEAEAVLARVHCLFGRLLRADLVTVGALNGHVFAAGAMLAVCCDLTVMRADRGYFCLPEADLGLPFTPGMNALLTARLSPPVAHRAMVTGHRFTADEAQASGIVTEVAAEDEVLDRSVALAATMLSKSRPTVGAIKRAMYGPVIDLLTGAV